MWDASRSSHSGECALHLPHVLNIFVQSAIALNQFVADAPNSFDICVNCLCVSIHRAANRTFGQRFLATIFFARLVRAFSFFIA